MDTNVLSVAIARRSQFYPIWLSLRNGEFALLVTTDILEEYEEIIGGDLSPELANFVLETLETLPNVHYIQKYYYWNLITADPDDDKFVDCAVAGSANFIVTNDKHFKVLRTIPFPKVEILSAEEFLEMVLQGMP
jgi:putative PIN family toxin of toxin-antitoxin system